MWVDCLAMKCINPLSDTEARKHLIVPLSIFLFFSGEMAKQMKVKKLKNLKTLDSKPGKCFILSYCMCLIFSMKHVT